MAFWGDSGGFLDDLETDGTEIGGGVDAGKSNQYEVGRDGLIFLIDATVSMFVKGEDEEGTPFQKSITCAKNVLMSKIISSDKDLVGVILFGTEKNQNSSDFPNVYDLQALDMPDADRILQLEQLESSDGVQSFGNDYGNSDGFALSDALWACSKMFASTTYKISHKRILLFTNNDDPHRVDNEKKKRAIRKAKDLSDLGIDLQLLHLKSEGEFDVNKFYIDIMDDEEEEGDLPDPAEKLDELMMRVRMKEYKKRSTASVAFQLGGGMNMGVSIYSLNRPQKKGSYIHVDSRTNEEVQCVTKYICRDTGQELLPTDIKFYQDFAGEKVIFEKEEVAQMKSLVDPGLTLIGFKPKDTLKLHYHIKPSSFLYPDDKKVEGSAALFTSLLNRCSARNVIPICTFARSNTAPRYVALVPQPEEIDEHGLQINPPGFHMVYLPYADDIRKLDVEEHPKANEQQIDKMKEIVDKLKFTYTSDSFENPALQKFYRCLEAFALDRDEVETFEDLTEPNTERMDKKAGSLIDEFKDMVFPPDYTGGPAKTTGKRPASKSADGNATKKVKAEEVDVDFHESAKRGNLNKLTVPILKAFCKDQKLKPSSQKKADLIQAINEHFSLA